MKTASTIHPSTRPAPGAWAIVTVWAPAVGRAVAEPCRVPVPAPNPVLRRPRGVRTLLAVVAAGLVAMVSSQPAAARAASAFGYVADGQLVDVQVRVDGQSAPLYFAPGRYDRRYFQAFRGRNYSLVVRNNTGRRVGVLIAVDGLNVVSGRRSNLSNDEAMYVLDPYEQSTIRGWRTSLDDVRRFVFVDEERSYAERTGQANGDLGWIRVLSFREQPTWRDNLSKLRGDENERPWGREGLPYDGGGSRAPGGASPEAKGAPNLGGAEDRAQRAPSDTRLEAERFRDDDSNPGTGWGDRRNDPVRETWFVAENFATDHMVLRYEYESGLRALGINTGWGRNRLRERERGELGFAQSPRW